MQGKILNSRLLNTAFANILTCNNDLLKKVTIILMISIGLMYMGIGRLLRIVITPIRSHFAAHELPRSLEA
jgi:hypothetical protein